MNLSEKEYLVACKRQIEEKFRFEMEQGVARQRDLEYLADAIEETSGIRLSLSTLKRLWKADYGQTPHPSTLQALVSVLGFKDWHDFKLHTGGNTAVPSPVTFLSPNDIPGQSDLSLGQTSIHLADAGIPRVQTTVQPGRSPTSHKQNNLKWWMVFPAAIALIVVGWLIAFRSAKPGEARPKIRGEVIFTGNKTVTQGVPNTVIFNYDLSKVDADSFFFQQSWNGLDKTPIDPKGHYYSNIYYYPGFHKAKLIANDSIIKIFKVHVTTNGWLPMLRPANFNADPVYFKKGAHILNGSLHTTPGDFKDMQLPADKEYALTYYNVREFEDTHSDHFTLDTRIVCDSVNNLACAAFEMVVMCETHIFIIRLMGSGCERNTGLKIGEVYLDGERNDLAKLGRDLYQWQKIRLEVVNNKGTIYIDDVPLYTVPFKQDLGKVVGLSATFRGTGAVDYVKLRNGNGKLVLDDEFGNEAGQAITIR